MLTLLDLIEAVIQIAVKQKFIDDLRLVHLE